jgi:hypothetical protein
MLSAGLWLGAIGLLLAVLVVVSSPASKGRMRRGGFSIGHLLILHSLWDPGKKYVFEHKQVQLEELDADGGPKKAGQKKDDPEGSDRA